MVAYCFLITLGDPEEHADHPHRRLCTQVGNEVEPFGADERIEAAPQTSRIFGSSSATAAG